MELERLRGMVVVKRTIDIAAPQEVVFDYVADHRNVCQFMEKVTRFEPSNGKKSGLGARFRWEVLVHGLNVGAEFEVTEFEPHEWMAAETISGPRSQSWWHFRRQNDGTRATFAAGYELPGIFLVKLVGTSVIEREIGSIFEASLRRLKGNLERKYQALRVSGQP